MEKDKITTKDSEFVAIDSHEVDEVLPWYMQFSVHAFELWFWRIAVPVALILSVIK